MGSKTRRGRGAAWRRFRFWCCAGSFTEGAEQASSPVQETHADTRKHGRPASGGAAELRAEQEGERRSEPRLVSAGQEATKARNPARYLTTPNCAGQVCLQDNCVPCRAPCRHRHTICKPVQRPVQRHSSDNLYSRRMMRSVNNSMTFMPMPELFIMYPHPRKTVSPWRTFLKRPVLRPF